MTGRRRSVAAWSFNEFTGSRCLTVRCLDDVHSAHQGSGRVGGQLAPGGGVAPGLYLDLNSGSADHNIFLQATGVDSWGSHIGGRWGESQFSGSVAHGTFLLDRTSQ